MTDHLVEQLRAEAARLREKADGLEAAARLIDEPPRTKAPKPKRSGEHRLPPPGGKRAARRAEAEAKIRQLLKTDPEVSVDSARKRLKLSWNLTKELLDRIRG